MFETPQGLAISDCGPSTTLPALRAGLGERGASLAELRHVLLTHIHLDHAGAAGTIVAENPAITVWVSRIGAGHLVDPSRLEASARRLYGARFDELFGELRPLPPENVAFAEGEVLGFETIPAPGHASHHVAYLRAGTLLAGDACGVRRLPDGGPLPISPPPDIDLPAWQATLAEIEQRAPERLALAHFGVATDVTRHLEALAAELERWAGLVKGGMGVEEFARVVGAGLEPADAVVYNEIAPFDHSWQGLRRYFDKRAQPAPSPAGDRTGTGA